MRKATTTTFLTFIICCCLNVMSVNAQISTSENGGEKLSMEEARKQAIEKAMEARELREQGLLVTKKSNVNKTKAFIEEAVPVVEERVRKKSKKKSKQKDKKGKSKFPKLKKNKLGLNKDVPSEIDMEEKASLINEKDYSTEVDEEIEIPETKRIKRTDIDDPRVGDDIVRANRKEVRESITAPYGDAEAPIVEATKDHEYGNAEMPVVERKVVEQSTDISTRSSNINTSVASDMSKSTTTTRTAMSNPMTVNSTTTSPTMSNSTKVSSAYTTIEEPEQKLTPTYTKVNSAILNEYEGKLVVLNFWFSKCKECLEEMPKLNALVDKYEGSGVTFLGMSLDDTAEIEKTLKTNPFKYQIVPRAKRYTDDFLVFLYPSHIVVNSRGEIIAHLAGSGRDTFNDLEKAIELGMTMK